MQANRQPWRLPKSLALRQGTPAAPPALRCAARHGKAAAHRAAAAARETALKALKYASSS